MSKTRVTVTVNKWWEFDPVLQCLISNYIRPNSNDHWPKFNDHPRPRRNPSRPQKTAPARPRCIFDFEFARVEVWCISDLLEHLPDKSKWQSSSERKAERLPEIFAGETVSLSIAVGTASSGDIDSRNGSVVIGTKSFLHNSKPNGSNPDSNWRSEHFDELLHSSITTDEFSAITTLESGLRRQVSSKLLSPPLAPAKEPQVLADYDAVALGNVNVTDYRDYDFTDRETIEAFKSAGKDLLLGSLETTHGLIRVLGSSRFIFVSGIVDRLNRFHEEVSPRPYAQNTAGAHNAGVVLAWLMPRLAKIF